MPCAHLYDAVAQELKGKTKDVKRTLDALFRVLVDTLKAEGTCRIPRVAMFVAKKKEAQEKRTKKLFGKKVVVPAKPATLAVRVRAVKQLRDMLC